MQTFLPYPDFAQSARCLDNKRLGKQRVESQQILSILNNSPNLKKTKTGKLAWENHPATKMWNGYENALKLYYNAVVCEWIYRGYKNTMPLYYDFKVNSMPWWLGVEEFHSSHRQTLLSKDYEHYSQFGWSESPKYEYWWPSKNLDHIAKIQGV